MKYSDDTNAALDGDPEFEMSSYTTVGARVALQSEEWTIALYGKNLTNEVAPISILSYGDSINRYVGEPRTVGLSLSYQY